MRDSDWMALVELALAEDLGSEGDVTSSAIFGDEKCRGALVCKDEGILAGEQAFSAVFTRLDPATRVSFASHDGARIGRGEQVAEVFGPVRSILSAERTAINFIAFLSGIATATRRLVDLAASAGRAVILDTRKTLPGWRALSKYAVTVGGGRNHRVGLYDMVLIKDNHIDAAGSIREAVERVRRRWGKRFKVEVECRTLEDTTEALAAGADILMLDNMDVEAMREAVRRAGESPTQGAGQWSSPGAVQSTVPGTSGRVSVEASGNMNAERIPQVSATGVDCISVGAITHSVRSLDFSLKVAR